VSDWMGVEASRDRHPTPEQAWLVGGVPFEVTPDGKEFKALPAEAAPASAGARIGLLLMESRIRMLGGDLAINSEKDKGTKVVFSVPPDGAPAA
ncbi:MAG TPA: hypothetical protein VE082_00445, partial [Desulfobaccales bacterium]|nr:hypothetical protein [Desulfobaccales bacterium]